MVKREVDKKFEKADIPPTWPDIEKVRERRRSGRDAIANEELKGRIHSPYEG